jgi:hypothetical protein
LTLTKFKVKVLQLLLNLLKKHVGLVVLKRKQLKMLLQILLQLLKQLQLTQQLKKKHSSATLTTG